MLVSAFSNETRKDSKAFPYYCQVKSKLFLDPRSIFDRILAALDVKNAPEAARLLGISKQAVYDWQKNTPSLENLLKVAESRNTSLHWIITGKGSRSADPKPSSVTFEEILDARIRKIVKSEISILTEADVSPMNAADMILAPSIGQVDDDTEEVSRKVI